MPVSFPTLDPDSGELVPVDYFTVGEVAALLHVSHSTVRRRVLANEWPHLTIAGGHYLNAVQVAAVVRMHTVEPTPAVPEDTRPPRLGTPLTDTDLEGVR
jgi:excisionase family DNA binding protein